MAAAGAIKVRERAGVVTLVEVERAHPEYRAHVSHKMAADGPPVVGKGGGGGGGGARGAGAGAGAGTGMQVLTLLVPIPAMAAVFEATPHDTPVAAGLAGTGPVAYTVDEARAVLVAYLEAQALMDDKSSVVRLDADLTDALYYAGKNSKSSAATPPLPKGPGGNTLYPTELRKTDALRQWLKRFDEHHAIIASRAELEAGRAKVRRGAPPCVSMELEKRGGGGKGKFVTHVRNLELYGIDPVELQRASKKHFACAASLADVPGKNDQSHQELAVAGDVVLKLTDLLIKSYNVPRKCITSQKGKGVAGGKKPKK